MKRALVCCASLLASAPARAEPPSFGPEILHDPIAERQAEQGILRPVPIRVSLPREVALGARRVLVHYRLWGEPDWTTLELRRTGAGYEGAIPCLEVSTVTGDLKYYLRVHDDEGRVIATGASRAAPYLVTIKHDTLLSSAQKRIGKCPDPADCPRGLPGCPSERAREIRCASDDDCEGEQTCGFRGVCERARRRHNWLSVSIQQEIGIVAAAGACSVHAQQEEGYACYRDDGAQYIGSAVFTNEPLAAGRGPTRVLAGYDRLLFYDTSVGVRAGWAFLGEGPTPRDAADFVPVMAAARVSHWFGDDPFSRPGWRPFAFVTGGYAQFDVAASIHVREDPSMPAFQGGNDLEQELELHKRAGDGFAGLGAGLQHELAGGFGSAAEVSVVEVFPFGATVVGASASIVLGF